MILTLNVRSNPNAIGTREPLARDAWIFPLIIIIAPGAARAANHHCGIFRAFHLDAEIVKIAGELNNVVGFPIEEARAGARNRFFPFSNQIGRVQPAADAMDDLRVNRKAGIQGQRFKQGLGTKLPRLG